VVQILSRYSYSFSISTDHRILESLELEGTSEGHQIQLPCNAQGQHSTGQVVQDLIQPGLESLQGWGINHISGQPVPVPHHPHCKRFVPYI